MRGYLKDHRLTSLIQIPLVFSCPRNIQLAPPILPALGADDEGVLRYALVDPVTGAESPGEPLSPDDLAWVQRWWPEGTRVELGAPRDTAWAEAVGSVLVGAALTVDYGHILGARPLVGTLTGFFAGRGAPTIPDGSADLTAHVAMDAARAAGEAVSGQSALLLTQRDALTRLGVDGTRPPIDLAHRDPQGYIRGLSGATQAAELTDPAGLGGHYWIVQPVGLPLEALPLGWAD